MFKRKKQEEPDGKNKRKKLEEILELAYLDLVADNNGYNQAI